MFSGPVRGGTRGGQGDFKWSDVADDKDRENYLGHSILAPVGRWQKNKDITWYNKNGGAIDEEERLKAKREEIQRIKAAEEDALSAALGFKPTPRDLMSNAMIQSSSNAIPLRQSNKPDSPSRRENIDRKAEKAARKAARAAKREEKAKEAEERKNKKQSRKSSRYGQEDLEKSRRFNSIQEQAHERKNHHYRDLPEQESKRSKDHRSSEESRERNYHDHRDRSRGANSNRDISQLLNSSVEHQRERRYHSPIPHLSCAPSPPLRHTQRRRPRSPGDQPQETRRRSRSPHQLPPSSPSHHKRYNRSPSPAEQRTNKRNHSSLHRDH